MGARTCRSTSTCDISLTALLFVKQRNPLTGSDRRLKRILLVYKLLKYLINKDLKKKHNVRILNELKMTNYNGNVMVHNKQ